MGVNKVIYGNETLIDLTDTTVSPDKLVKGATAINASGDKIVGTVSLPNLYLETESGDIPVGSLELE